MVVSKEAYDKAVRDSLHRPLMAELWDKEEVGKYREVVQAVSFWLNKNYKNFLCSFEPVVTDAEGRKGIGCNLTLLATPVRSITVQHFLDNFASHLEYPDKGKEQSTLKEVEDWVTTVMECEEMGLEKGLRHAIKRLEEEHASGKV